jgi:predicted nucleic acid-binding protein
MGFLNIPANSLVYIDTAIIIYTIEKIPEYWLLLKPVWQQVKNRNIRVLSSELTLLEALVAPIRNNDATLITAYEQALLASNMLLMPITQSILRQAAHVRAQSRLKTPDAIHVATAQLEHCDIFLTNDKALQRIPSLNSIVINEFLDS